MKILTPWGKLHSAIYINIPAPVPFFHAKSTFILEITSLTWNNLSEVYLFQVKNIIQDGV